MATSPTVSVLVPTYNRVKSLSHTLESIEAQSFQDYELIVIDDGSTDETREMVTSLHDPRVRYVYQENQGLPAAWNTGIKTSSGKYLAFLDSDDTWLKDKLKIQVAFLEGTVSQFPGCVTGYFFHALNGRQTAVIPRSYDAALRSILWKNILHLGTTFMCRREVFEEIGLFDENLRRAQDSDWLIRYRKRFEIGIIPEALAVFTQHLSRSGAAMEKSMLYLLEKHKDNLLAYGNLFYRRKAAIIYRDLAFQFSRENNPNKVREYSRKSILTYPTLSPGLWLTLIDAHLGTQLKKQADSIKYPGAFK